MCFIRSQTVQTTAFVLDTDNMEALEPLKGRLHKMTFSWNLGASWFLFWIDLLFQECVFFSLSTFMVNPWPLASHWGDSEKFPRKQILGSGGAAWAEFLRAGNFWTRKNHFVCEHFQMVYIEEPSILCLLEYCNQKENEFGIWKNFWFEGILKLISFRFSKVLSQLCNRSRFYQNIE